MYTMESQIRKDVEGEYKNKMMHRENQIEDQKRQFGEFKKDVVATWNHGIATESEKVNKVISKMPEAYRENLSGPSPTKFPIPRESEDNGVKARNMMKN